MRKIRSRRKPETIIQNKIMDLLKTKDWFVKHTHGNAFQAGFPDLYAAHRIYGTRWIEVKNPTGYAFTPAQLDTFPMFAAKGVGIWVLTAATELEYLKLFKPPNWGTFLKF